jgi:hypothetical protein
MVVLLRGAVECLVMRALREEGEAQRHGRAVCEAIQPPVLT